MYRLDVSFALGSFLLAAQLLIASAASAQSLPEQWIIGETVEFESQILDETRQLIIGKPYEYDTREDSFPVLYLLDGPSHFSYTTSIIGHLSRHERIPEMLVVAIANTDRVRDLTTPSQQEGEIARHPTHGGADNFLRFLRDELAPWVDASYRTMPHRVLIGHSRGGLFVIHALITDPTLFDSYVAISPSVDWNAYRLVADAEAFFENRPELDSRLYMTAGNEGGSLLEGVRNLSALLDELAPAGFEWQFDWLPEENHGSVTLPSTLEGLNFVFFDYYLPDIFATFDEQGLDGIMEFYARSGERLGIERKPPLNAFFEIFNRSMSNARIDDAAMIADAEWATFSPPMSEELMIDAWSWVVQGYINEQRPERAAEYYRKILEYGGPISERYIRSLNEMGIAPVE